MPNIKPLDERKMNFIKRLERLYPDYKLISEYVNNDTMVVLKHKDGYYWETKPRYLDGKRQCKEIARQNKRKKSSKAVS